MHPKVHPSGGGVGAQSPFGNKALTSQQMADGSQLSAPRGSPQPRAQPSQGCRHPVTSEVGIKAQLPPPNSRACGSPMHRTRPHVFLRTASAPKSFRLPPSSGETEKAECPTQSLYPGDPPCKVATGPHRGGWTRMQEPSEPTLSPEQNRRRHLPRFPQPHNLPLGYL